MSNKPDYLNALESIQKWNDEKKELIDSLKKFLEDNKYRVTFETFLDSTKVGISEQGYILTVTDLSSLNESAIFKITNQPKSKKMFKIEAMHNISNREVKLYRTLLDFIIESKIAIKFNLDLLAAVVSK